MNDTQEKLVRFLRGQWNTSLCQKHPFRGYVDHSFIEAARPNPPPGLGDNLCAALEDALAAVNRGWDVTVKRWGAGRQARHNALLWAGCDLRLAAEARKVETLQLLALRTFPFMRKSLVEGHYYCKMPDPARLSHIQTVFPAYLKVGASTDPAWKDFQDWLNTRYPVPTP